MMEMRPQQAEVQPISAWRRFLNFTVDMIVYFVASLASGVVLGLLLPAELFEEGSLFPYVVSYGIFFLYYLVFEGVLQRTPAKFLTGTKVITENGGKPTAGAIALRTLSRLVPFEVISMYTGKDATKKGTWWHDRWTHTRVVRA